MIHTIKMREVSSTKRGKGEYEPEVTHSHALLTFYAQESVTCSSFYPCPCRGGDGRGLVIVYCIAPSPSHGPIPVPPPLLIPRQRGHRPGH